MLLKNKSNCRPSPKAVVECSRHDLRSGRLAQLFHSGVKAVILNDDPRVAQLWEALRGRRYGSEMASDRALPWEQSILDVARNHRPGDVSLGDMVRFVPDSIAHVARKVQIFPNPDTRMMQVIPEIWNGTQRVVVPDDISRTAWELMSDIFRSTVNDGSDALPDAVAIELLKYPDSTSDLDKIFSLLADAAGGWARLGRRLDNHKVMASGMFDAWIVRDLFSWAYLIPGARDVLHKLNGASKSFKRRHVPENARLIGEPHTDRSKVLTALVSDRDVIRTEIYDGEKWLELPLSRDTLAIFPSHKLDRSLGIAPTLHRVVLLKERASPTAIKPNITLSLAITDRPPPELC